MVSVLYRPASGRKFCVRFGGYGEDQSHCIRFLIWSAKNSLYGPAKRYFSYLKFAHSSIQIIYFFLQSSSFEGCYFGAILGSVKIAKIKCL